jgi:hypothetical protein
MWRKYSGRSLKWVQVSRPSTFYILFYFGFGFGFWDRISLCSPGWPQTLNSPASASWVLGLVACATHLAYLHFILQDSEAASRLIMLLLQGIFWTILHIVFKHFKGPIRTRCILWNKRSRISELKADCCFALKNFQQLELCKRGELSCRLVSSWPWKEK